MNVTILSYTTSFKTMLNHFGRIVKKFITKYKNIMNVESLNNAR